MPKLSFTQLDVEVLSEQPLYEGFFQAKRIQFRHKRFAGGWSETLTYELFERNPGAGVLPYDPSRDEIVLIEQFRIGCIRDTAPWLLEIVAGIIEDGETAEDMAHRELKEEAGLPLLKLHKAYEFYSSPGGSSEHVTLFCAEVDTSQAGGLFGAMDEHEDIKVHVFPYEKAMLMLKTGQIRNAITIMALQWLALNRDSIWR